jgi:hypothetical protein
VLTSRAWGLVGWGVVFALVLVWQGLAMTRRAWPTLSGLLEAVTWAPARWVAFALWLWVGWHVFVRTWALGR